ncbi:MAG TPA: hypothetical protein VJO72_14420 [Candidatus Dormibacteraeota bacterium]|nr:hypothetical protein [Candidatus Dormibacteraeota bacterium]
MNTPEQELHLAFARMAGMVLAFILLTVGGGVALIVGAALIVRFVYGG